MTTFRFDFLSICPFHDSTTECKRQCPSLGVSFNCSLRLYRSVLIVMALDCGVCMWVLFMLVCVGGIREWFITGVFWG
jgi:hypothetical protein